MKIVEIPPKKCEVIADVDVVVCGGGPSGIGAAVSAARCGARTVLIDEGGCLGGAIPKGMVTSIMGGIANSGDKILIKGLWAELMDRMVKKRGAIWGHELINSNKFHPYDKSRCEKDLQISIFDPEIFKLCCEDMVSGESNITIMLYSKVTDVIVVNSEVRGVIVDNIEGKQCILTKRTIDATGNATVARMSGVQYEVSFNNNKGIGPALVFFSVDGVDDVCPTYKPNVKEIPYGAVNMFPLMRHNQYRVEMNRAMVNGLNNESMTKATLECRRQIPKIIDWLKSHWQGCENISLISSGDICLSFSFPKLCAVGSLKVENVLNGDIPEDVIYLTGYGIDIHSTEEGGQNTLHFLQPGEYYGVGYSSIVPKSPIENILVVGRNAACEAGTEAAVISSATSMSSGQAAGAASVLSIMENVSVKNIDIKELQLMLGHQGVIFEPVKAVRKFEPIEYIFDY